MLTQQQHSCQHVFRDKAEFYHVFTNMCLLTCPNPLLFPGVDTACGQDLYVITVQNALTRAGPVVCQKGYVTQAFASLTSPISGIRELVACWVFTWGI